MGSVSASARKSQIKHRSPSKSTEPLDRRGPIGWDRISGFLSERSVYPQHHARNAGGFLETQGKLADLLKLRGIEFDLIKTFWWLLHNLLYELRRRTAQRKRERRRRRETLFQCTLTCGSRLSREAAAGAKSGAPSAIRNFDLRGRRMTPAAYPSYACSSKEVPGSELSPTEESVRTPVVRENHDFFHDGFLVAGHRQDVTFAADNVGMSGRPQLVFNLADHRRNAGERDLFVGIEFLGRQVAP